MRVVRDSQRARAPSKHDFDGLALLWLQLAGALCVHGRASSVRVLAQVLVPGLPTSSSCRTLSALPK